MTAPNIEHFNRVVLVTLDRLYDAFPVPIELKTAEIAEAATPGTLPPEPSFNEIEPTFEAVKFLAAEGFLQYSDYLRSRDLQHKSKLRSRRARWAQQQMLQSNWLVNCLLRPSRLGQ